MNKVVYHYINDEFKRFKAFSIKAMTNVLDMKSDFKMCACIMLDVIEGIEK